MTFKNLFKKTAYFFICSAFAFSLPVQSFANDTAPIIKERDEMFMLATLAYIFNTLKCYPQVGYPVASIVAWDVENTLQTPDFALDKNRNFEEQGDIFHAEVVAIRTAFLKKRTFNIAPSASISERYENFTYKLANTTLYTSLEPCPMCAATLVVARIPRVIYFMKDFGFRDADTGELNISLPNDIFGRHTSYEMSTLPLAEDAHKAMMETMDQVPPPAYVFQLPDGKMSFNPIEYFGCHAMEIFSPGYEQFSQYQVQFAENIELFDNLKKAVGSHELLPSTGRLNIVN